MTVAAPLRAVPERARPPRDSEHELRALLRDDFLAASGWDEAGQVFAPDRDHPLLGLRKCAVADCEAGVRTPNVELCSVCIERFKGSGLSMAEFAAVPTGKKKLG